MTPEQNGRQLAEGYFLMQIFAEDILILNKIPLGCVCYGRNLAIHS